MKIETQVTSPKTALQLATLGVRIKSIYGYKRIDKNSKTTEFVLVKSELAGYYFSGYLHTYTIAELGEMIPWGYFQASKIQKMPGGIWSIKINDGRVLYYDSEVEARASYLIDLLMTKVVSLDEVNHPERFHQPIIKPKDILPQTQ